MVKVPLGQGTPCQSNSHLLLMLFLFMSIFASLISANPSIQADYAFKQGVSQPMGQDYSQDYGETDPGGDPLPEGTKENDPIDEYDALKGKLPRSTTDGRKAGFRQFIAGNPSGFRQFAAANNKGFRQFGASAARSPRGFRQFASNTGNHLGFRALDTNNAGNTSDTEVAAPGGVPSAVEGTKEKDTDDDDVNKSEQDGRGFFSFLSIIFPFLTDLIGGAVGGRSASDGKKGLRQFDATDAGNSLGFRQYDAANSGFRQYDAANSGFRGFDASYADDAADIEDILERFRQLGLDDDDDNDDDDSNGGQQGRFFGDLIIKLGEAIVKKIEMVGKLGLQIFGGILSPPSTSTSPGTTNPAVINPVNPVNPINPGPGPFNPGTGIGPVHPPDPANQNFIRRYGRPAHSAFLPNQISNKRFDKGPRPGYGSHDSSDGGSSEMVQRRRKPGKRIKKLRSKRRSWS